MVRNGIYTILKGQEYKVYEERSEVPHPIGSENILLFKHELISGKYEEIQVASNSINKDKLPCSYRVSAFGKILGAKVSVQAPKKMDIGRLLVYTSSYQIAEILGLFKVGTSFEGIFPVQDFEQIWEEIEPSIGFELPADVKSISWIKE